MTRTSGSVSGLSWGDCRILQVPTEVNLEFDDSPDPPRISSLVFDSKIVAKLAELNPKAKVRIDIKRRLRKQRLDGGTLDDLKNVPIDTDTRRSTLDRVGTGPRSWQLRVVDSTGFVLAQTKIKRTSEVIFDAGDPDNPLLTISKDVFESARAWDVDLSSAGVPEVRVHETMDELYRRLKAKEAELFHILPQIVSEIIDYLIKQHFDSTPIDSHPTGNWQRGWVDVLSMNYNTPLPELDTDDPSHEARLLLKWKADTLDSICRDIDIRGRLTNQGGDGR